jgi:Tol biopolymer transport system component
MDATDGAVIRDLAPREVCDVDWAPNGRRLVYLRRTSTGDCDFAAADVFVVRADGTGDRRLIRMPRPRFVMSWRAQDVAWSPDGRRIAYVRGKAEGDTTRYSLIITDTRGQNIKVIYVTERGLVGESLPDYGPTISWQPLGR